MKFNIKCTVLLIALLTIAGCDVEGRYTQGIHIDKTTTLTTGVVISESGEKRLIYIEPQKSSVKIKEFFCAGDNEHLMWSSAGPNPTNPKEYFQMVIPIDERDSETKEILHRFSFDGSEISKVTYEVNSPFSNIVFSPGQDFGILYHSENQDPSDFDIVNPNEIAMLKLDEAPGETNPSITSVDLGGHRITGVTFLPEISVGGVSMQFVVFMAKGIVRLVDLLNPESTKRIKLITDDDPRNVIPVQVIVRDGDESRNPMVFIRATDSQDIYAITLAPDLDGDSLFLASMNQFESFGDPLDMLLIKDGNDPYLTVLSTGTSSQGNTSIINVIDIDTSHSFKIVVDDYPDTLLLRQGKLGEEVVVYGNGTQKVHFLQSDGVVSEQQHNLDDVDIPDGISHSLLLDSDRLLILPDSGQDIIILNLETRKTSRFSAPTLNYDDWASAQIFENWFFFVPGSNDRVGLVDLTTNHPDSLLLDDYISSLHLIEETALGLCLHDTPTGRLTVFPIDDPTRGNSYVIDGLWLSNFLNGTEVTQ